MDEVVLVYSQPQPLYMELAAAVPVVKMVRLEESLSLEDFLRLVGTDRRPVRALIFDDVEPLPHLRDTIDLFILPPFRWRGRTSRGSGGSCWSHSPALLTTSMLTFCSRLTNCSLNATSTESFNGSYLDTG